MQPEKPTLEELFESIKTTIGIDSQWLEYAYPFLCHWREINEGAPGILAAGIMMGLVIAQNRKKAEQ